MAQRSICARCGRVGTNLFVTDGEERVCAAEKACRRRIVDAISDDVPDLDEMGDRLFSRYRRSGVDHPLGVFSPSEAWLAPGDGVYWVGVHTWREGLRIAWLVFFNEPGMEDPAEWDKGEWTAEFVRLASCEAITSERWVGFRLLPLDESDLRKAAQGWVDQSARRRSDIRIVPEGSSWVPGVRVPPFKKYSASEHDMDGDQLSFYLKWMESWKSGTALDVEGWISYLFVYANDVRGGLPPEEAAAELGRLATAFSHESHFANYCWHWAVEAWIAAGDYSRAHDSGARSGRMDLNTSWSLLLILGAAPSGKEIAQAAGVDMSTAFRSEHQDEILPAVAQLFQEFNEVAGGTLLEDWALGCGSKEWPRSDGERSRGGFTISFEGDDAHMVITPREDYAPRGRPRLYFFDRAEPVRRACKEMAAIAEHRVHEQQGD